MFDNNMTIDGFDDALFSAIQDEESVGRKSI